jgi:uncharacterized protein (TIGR00266 family)|tara:strand:+ start:605 stop:1468 length:864 start_codon:yes stop_codon:yes gene_type:complete
MNISISRNGQQYGPYSAEQVQQMLASGQLAAADLAYTEGMSEWKPLGELLASPPGNSAASAETGQHDLDHVIDGKPDFAFVTVQVPGEQTLKVEASAMATMSTNMEMKTKFKGGFSRFLTGESIFINEFTARGGSGEIGIAPGSPGDLVHYYVNNREEIYLQSSAFVASGMGVEVDSKWQGFKGFFSGESLFLIRCAGQGDLWFNTYGAIIEIDVSGDYVVDTGHIVAFTSGLQYNVTSVGNMKSLFFSGEGLVCRFTGQGRLWVQTRQLPSLAWWVHPYRRVEKSN